MNGVAGLFALATTVLLGACVEEVTPPESPPRPVRTEIAQTIDGSEPITLAGVSRASLESRLSFRVGGTIEQIAVEIGDRVRRGQALARLDTADYELKLEEAEASLAQTEAAARQAQADYSRARALYENNNASKSELDAARALAESADAQVAAGNKRVELAQRQLDYTVLRAPVDGAIARLGVEVNENASAGQEIFLLTGGARPEVVVAVPEVAIAAIEEGQQVQVRFDALPGQSFVGRVSEVGVAATGATSTFEVTAEIDDASPAIRSGMAADVSMVLEHRGLEHRGLEHRGNPSRLAVPLVAVGEDGDGRYVFVLERRGEGVGLVHRRSVEVGELLPGALEIRSGLEAGEEVVTAGVRRLVDGMEVRAPVSSEAGG